MEDLMNAALVPIYTAVLTFALTTIFTVYKDRKNRGLKERVLFDHQERNLRYDFEIEESLGWGKILYNKHHNEHEKNRKRSLPLKYSIWFQVIKNISENDALDVVLTIKSTDTETWTDKFSLPIVRKGETLYVPLTDPKSRGMGFVTNELFQIDYKTLGGERFLFKEKRVEKDGLTSYKTRFYKYYLWFIRIPIIKYRAEGDSIHFREVK